MTRNQGTLDLEELETELAGGEIFSSLQKSRLSTVLVIEDNADLNTGLCMRLSHSNMNVISALDGVHGLQAAFKEQPDVVLLDLGLPRMHGLKLLHHLRMEPQMADTPVIVLTGTDDPELVEKSKRWGVSRVLRKPIRQAQIVEEIQEVLEEN